MKAMRKNGSHWKKPEKIRKTSKLVLSENFRLFLYRELIVRFPCAAYLPSEERLSLMVSVSSAV